MIKAPNYRVMISLDALHPQGHELAWLELHAQSAEEANNLADTFLRSEALILSVTQLTRDE